MQELTFTCRPVKTRNVIPAKARIHVVIGLDPELYDTRTMRRTEATLIHKRTKNLRTVQLLPGHGKFGSTARYLGVEVDDALEHSEQTEIQLRSRGHAFNVLFDVAWPRCSAMPYTYNRSTLLPGTAAALPPVVRLRHSDSRRKPSADNSVIPDQPATIAGRRLRMISVASATMRPISSAQVGTS